MKYGTFLVGLVKPLLAKILLTLGFSVVSIVGLEAAFGAVKDIMVSNLNSVPANYIGFALYMWIGKGIGIIMGACATKLALWHVQNATKILAKGNG